MSFQNLSSQASEELAQPLAGTPPKDTGEQENNQDGEEEEEPDDENINNEMMTTFDDVSAEEGEAINNAVPDEGEVEEISMEQMQAAVGAIPSPPNPAPSPPNPAPSTPDQVQMPPPPTPEVPRKKKRLSPGGSQALLDAVDETDPTFQEIELEQEEQPVEQEEQPMEQVELIDVVTGEPITEPIIIDEIVGQITLLDEEVPPSPVRQEMAQGMLNTLQNAMKKKKPTRTVNRRRYRSLEDDDTLAHLKKKQEEKEAKEKRAEERKRTAEEKKIEATVSRRVHEESQQMMETVAEEGIEGLQRKMDTRAKSGRGGARAGARGGRGGAKAPRGGATAIPVGGVRTRGGGVKTRGGGRQQVAKRGGSNNNVSPPTARDIFSSDLNITPPEYKCDRLVFFLVKFCKI